MNVEMLKKKDIESYIKYIDLVFGYQPAFDQIEKMIKKNKVFIIKNKDDVVASASVEEKFEYIKGQKYFYITYLGVLKEYRRKGYASLIFSKIEDLAKQNNVNYLELNSGNQRRSAHYFYKSKNFKIKDTSVFVKIY